MFTNAISMSLRFIQRILEHLSHEHYRPSFVKDIARDMRIEPDDRDEFEQAIHELGMQGRLIVGDDDLVRLPTFGDEVTGKFRLNPKGFGFVIPDTPTRQGDLFVPPGNAGTAISGDRVRAKVIRAAGRDRPGPGAGGRSPFIGRIVEVLDRGQEHFVGTLIKDGKRWFVEPDGRSLHNPVLIRDPHAKNAKEGDKVVIELVHYPDDQYVAEGVIVNVLGEAGRPDVETQAVIAAHGLRTDFPAEALAQARDASRSFDHELQSGAVGDREDLRDEFIFTIDPPDAKDFDDAISIAYDAVANEWTLGVHIADVSHFVTQGSALDEEAKARGNSVYLPRLVIPMLPEVLSNGVCSLQEGVPRFTKSAFIRFDGKGNVIHQRLSSSIIQSRKRLTYIEAQALIDGNEKMAREHARTETEYAPELIEKLQLSNRLAKLLEARRMRDGMIVLSLPEVDLVFDDNGHVIDAQPEDDSYTHKIIEMFMVEANEALARTFDDLDIPIIRRIHPEPAHGDLEELRMFARAADVTVPDEPSRRDLQQLLEATRHTPAARAIHFAVLRTLAKASYSPALVGHFALASEHYAHFTSPIRRYPDLTLHRVMQAYLDATDNGRNLPGGKKRRELGRRIAEDERAFDEGLLIELGKHCSETEIEAEQAERELREFLVMQFLHEKHLGDEFPGVITGMMPSGIFVSIDRFLVEGKISLKDLSANRVKESSSGGGKSDDPVRSGKQEFRGDGQTRRQEDRWTINESTGRATAQRSGAVIAVGDIITVQIAAVNLASRHLDLIITKFPMRAAPPHVQNQKGARDERHADERGTRRGHAIGRDKKVQRGKRKGFKQGRRGRRSR